jgi:hypothetical protein
MSGHHRMDCVNKTAQMLSAMPIKKHGVQTPRSGTLGTIPNTESYYKRKSIAAMRSSLDHERKDPKLSDQTTKDHSTPSHPASDQRDVGFPAGNRRQRNADVLAKAFAEASSLDQDRNPAGLFYSRGIAINQRPGGNGNCGGWDGRVAGSEGVTIRTQWNAVCETGASPPAAGRSLTFSLRKRLCHAASK